MGNRLFTTPGTANTAPTTHSQRDVDCHCNGGIVESDNDVQRGTVMSDTRNVVVESHKQTALYIIKWSGCQIQTPAR